jgi:hypothetical protein
MRAVSKTPKAPHNSAEKSKPTAQPAASLAAKGTNGSHPGPSEVDYDLPTAADIAAVLKSESAEPAGSKSDNADVEDIETVQTAEDASDGADSQPDDTAAEADDAAADEPASDAEAEADSSDAEAKSENDSADEDAEQEADAEDASDEPKEPKKSGAERRIEELLRERRESDTKYESQLAQLREQLAAAKQERPDPLNPFATIDDPQDLQAAERRERAVFRWALENEHNPDGADMLDEKGQKVHFEPEEIRRIKLNTYDILNQVEPRREFLREKAAREQSAAEVYPWLRSIKDGPGAEVQKLIEDRPYLRQSPDYKLLAADAVVGARLRAAGVKLDEKSLASLAKGKPLAAVAGKTVAASGVAELAKSRSTPVPGQSPVRRTAPSPARPGTLPARITGREAAVRHAGKALTTNGDLDSVSNSIAAKLRW